jgi:hypothetical protein
MVVGLLVHSRPPRAAVGLLVAEVPPSPEDVGLRYALQCCMASTEQSDEFFVAVIAAQDYVGDYQPSRSLLEDLLEAKCFVKKTRRFPVDHVMIHSSTQILERV